MNSSSFTDPEAFISGVAPGRAIFGRWSEDNNNFETGFFIDKKGTNNVFARFY